MYALIRFEHEARTKHGYMYLVGLFDSHEDARKAMYDEWYNETCTSIENRRWIDENAAWCQTEFFDDTSWYIFDSEDPKAKTYYFDSYSWGLEED